MTIGIIIIFGLIVFVSRLMIFRCHQSSVNGKCKNGKCKNGKIE